MTSPAAGNRSGADAPGDRVAADSGTNRRRSPGTVYLVGAGPGHPGLLTLRGKECIGKADLVLYDYLANPSLVEHASPRAELIRLGHHKGGPRMTPAQITAAMVDAALEGRSVCRLKGGDPAVFGRLADEVDALRRLGIPYEVVPGITSGLALGAFAEVPVTHHDDASAVALVTGHERGGKEHSNLDFEGLAKFPGTLIFYMGVKRAAQWSSALMDHGKAPETPVAIVRWCSRARQQTVCCTLGTVADVVESRGVRPPALFVVGEVVKHSPCLSWFETRPLFGSTVLVAGSVRTAERLREQLAERGAEVIVQPAIEVAPPPSWDPVDETLGRIRDYDWLVFSTPNGVDALMNRILDLGTDARRLGGVRIAAIGKGTADRLRAYQIQPELVPDVYEPTRLATRLIPEGSSPRFLMACGPDRPTLSEELEVFGGRVDELVVYDTVSVNDPDPDVNLALIEREIDWVAVTSATTARAIDQLYGDNLRQARIASISPLTSKVLRGLGIDPAVEASPPTVTALVDGITAAVEPVERSAAAPADGALVGDAGSGE